MSVGAVQNSRNMKTLDAIKRLQVKTTTELTRAGLGSNKHCGLWKMNLEKNSKDRAVLLIPYAL